MKRAVCLIFSLLLALTAAVPALAMTPPAPAEDMEATLQDITLLVKNTLDIGDDYTDFYSSYNDGLRPSWYLDWSAEGEDLSVQYTTDGVITEVFHWRSSESSNSFYGFDAAFPALSESAARRQAAAWLARLTGQNEHGRIDSVTSSLGTDGEYSVRGRILMNGLESPVTFSLRLGENGLSSYTRSDGYSGYVGGAPAAKASADKPSAAALLKEAVELELYYVNQHDGTARLQYVPVGAYTVVDAQSGEAVDMDALYASFGGSYYGPEEPMAMEAAAMDAGNGTRGLTEVELSSIANYGKVLPQEELDSRLRALPYIGLDGFAPIRCSYGMDAEGVITASLRYSCKMTDDNLFGFSRDAYREAMEWNDDLTVYKYVTMDAKTGELLTLSTSYPLWDDDRDTVIDFYTDPIPQFLEAAAPEKYPETALCTLQGYDTYPTSTYAQVHEGYFYPENNLRVTLNESNATVDEYYVNWDEDIGFAPAKGIVSEVAAIDTYTKALAVTLGYVAWPEGIDYDDPIYETYIDWGYTWVESLRLAYYYSGTDTVSGVDALTGEAIAEAPDGGYVYDDLADEPERAAIERLGRSGIGFAGGSFRPAEALVQRDALTLLLGAAGYRTADWDDDTIKSEAVWLGFITDGEFAPETPVTQATFLRMILRASRYGDAAALPGIWAEGYADGYAAVADALGMLTDNYAPESVCTRAVAAVMLYRFMTR